MSSLWNFFFGNDPLTELWHFHDSNHIINESLSKTYVENPKLAKRIIDVYVKKGQRKPDYMKHRLKDEKILFDNAKKLCLVKTKFPTYAVIPLQEDQLSKQHKNITLIPVKETLKYTTFTVGDSMHVLHPPTNKTLTYKTSYALSRINELDEKLINEQLKVFSKHGAYLEAQIWLPREVLINLCK